MFAKACEYVVQYSTTTGTCCQCTIPAMSTIPCCLAISMKLDCTEDVDRCLFTNDAARVLAVTCSRTKFLWHLPSRRLSLPSQNRSSDTKATKRIHQATDEVDGRGLEGTCSATASEPSLPEASVSLEPDPQLRSQNSSSEMTATVENPPGSDEEHCRGLAKLGRDTGQI